MRNRTNLRAGYGQSNEVGQMADFGYDTAARNLANLKANGMQILGIAWGGPTAVQLIGTFAINNFGGLGGGL